MRVYIRVPNLKQRRRSFFLYCDGKSICEPGLAAINKSYLAGELDFNSARRELDKIAQEIRQRANSTKHVYLEQNLDVLQRAVNEYQGRPRIRERSRRMAIAGLRRSTNLLGNLNIFSATVKELERLIQKERPEAQPKIALYLNRLLDVANREERVTVPSSPDPDVLYLTRKEFKLVLPFFREDLKDIVTTGFVTGCRLGEVFALDTLGRKRSVWVTKQMYHEQDEWGEWYGPCKWRKKRWAPVMKWGLQSVRNWMERLRTMKEQEKIELRLLPWNELVKQACKEAFPEKAFKHLTFRDIRHCYAIYWLDEGATTRNVAQAMGNSERVVTKHYSGFIQTAEAEEAMLALENKKKKKKVIESTPS